jgi:hypothetical protein
MVRRALFVALSAWMAAMPLFVDEAHAQAEADTGKLEACLAKAADSADGKPAACVGTIADPCMAAAGTPATYDCFMREADAWMTVGRQRVDGLLARSRPEVAEAVRVSQSAWEQYREAHCAATGTFFYQYSGSASAEWETQCRRDTAAERALLLDDWLMRSEDFE